MHSGCCSPLRRERESYPGRHPLRRRNPGGEFAVQAEPTTADRELREYTIASIAQLDETTREAALEAGRNMSLEEAIDYALQTLA